MTHIIKKGENGDFNPRLARIFSRLSTGRFCELQFAQRQLRP